MAVLQNLIHGAFAGSSPNIPAEKNDLQAREHREQKNRETALLLHLLKTKKDTAYWAISS